MANKKWSEKTLITESNNTTEICILDGDTLDNKRISAENLLSPCVLKTSVVNSLTSDSTTSPLSASKGKDLQTQVNGKVSTPNILLLEGAIPVSLADGNYEWKYPVNNLTSENYPEDGALAAAQGPVIVNLINERAPKANPTFTGVVVLPSTTTIGNISSTELGYLNNLTGNIQTQLDSKNKTTVKEVIWDSSNTFTYTLVPGDNFVILPASLISSDAYLILPDASTFQQDCEITIKSFMYLMHITPVETTTLDGSTASVNLGRTVTVVADVSENKWYVKSVVA